MQRKIRVLVGKPGLDGHDRGAKVVAAALRDAGMEVIYTGLHQTPRQIVDAAVQEDVDVVALSILSGAHMTLFPEVQELMRSVGIGDKLLTGGGIIPPEDMDSLAKSGIGRLFGPGSSTQDIVVYIREWFASVHGADALPPLPPPPAPRALEESFGAMPSVARPRPAALAKRDAGEAAHHARAAKPKKKPAAKPKRRAAAKPAKKSAAKPMRRAAAKPAKKSAAKPKRKAAAKRRAGRR